VREDYESSETATEYGEEEEEEEKPDESINWGQKMLPIVDPVVKSMWFL